MQNSRLQNGCPQTVTVALSTYFTVCAEHVSINTFNVLSTPAQFFHLTPKAIWPALEQRVVHSSQAEKRFMHCQSSIYCPPQTLSCIVVLRLYLWAGPCAAADAAVCLVKSERSIFRVSPLVSRVQQGETPVLSRYDPSAVPRMPRPSFYFTAAELMLLLHDTARCK